MPNNLETKVLFNYETIMLCQDIMSLIFLIYPIRHKYMSINVQTFLSNPPVVVTFGVIAKSVIITPKSTPTPYTSGQKQPLKD